MLELVVSPFRDFVVSKVQSSNRTGLYLRENLCRELHDLQERHLYPDTEEPAYERLLVLSFIRRPHSTVVPERTIFESSELDSLYRSITLNTIFTILAKKGGICTSKTSTPSLRRNTSSPSKTYPASFSIPMLDRNSRIQSTEPRFILL